MIASICKNGPSGTWYSHEVGCSRKKGLYCKLVRAMPANPLYTYTARHSFSDGSASFFSCRAFYHSCSNAGKEPNENETTQLRQGGFSTNL